MERKHSKLTKFVVVVMTFVFTACFCTLTIDGIIKAAAAKFVGKAASGTAAHTETLTSSVNAPVTMTFLVHGMGANHQSWSNGIYDSGNGVYINNQRFAYRPESLIERLRTSGNGKVYRVDSEAVSTTGNYSGFSLQECFAAQIGENYNLGPYLTEFSNLSEHSIFVLNMAGKSNVLADAYAELHDIIDRILYDFKYFAGYVPQINLVGHSRGGLLNAMYTSDHPTVVDSVFSMGTPYNGSVYLDILLFFGTEVSSGYLQTVDPAALTQIKSKWNSMISATPTNQRPKAYAMAGNISNSYLDSLIRGGYINASNFAYTPSQDDGFLLRLLVYALAEAGDLLAYQPNYDTLLNSIVSLVMQALQNSLVNDLIDIINTLTLGIMNDMFIDVFSQCALGYNGFSAPVFTFTSSNTNFGRVSIGKVPIPHNLEQQHVPMIDYILSKIVLNKCHTNIQFVSWNQLSHVLKCLLCNNNFEEVHTINIQQMACTICGYSIKDGPIIIPNRNGGDEECNHGEE